MRVWVLLLLLAGCSESLERAVKVDRKEAARTAADQSPKRAVYRFENGELLVLDIATVGPGGYADSQKCFLWRDTDFKTASLQCPSDSPGELGHAEPEKNQP